MWVLSAAGVKPCPQFTVSQPTEQGKQWRQMSFILTSSGSEPNQLQNDQSKWSYAFFFSLNYQIPNFSTTGPYPATSFLWRWKKPAKLYTASWSCLGSIFCPAIDSWQEKLPIFQARWRKWSLATWEPVLFWIPIITWGDPDMSFLHGVLGASVQWGYLYKLTYLSVSSETFFLEQVLLVKRLNKPIQKSHF